MDRLEAVISQSFKKDVLKNFSKFSGKHLSQSLFFNKKETLFFIKKETLKQVFSCEICEISKNTFSYRTPPVAASDRWAQIRPTYV